jgi:hypothetical protein
MMDIAQVATLPKRLSSACTKSDVSAEALASWKKRDGSWIQRSVRRRGLLFHHFFAGGVVAGEVLVVGLGT